MKNDWEARALTPAEAVALVPSGANVFVHYNSSAGPAEETAAEFVQSEMSKPVVAYSVLKLVEPLQFLSFESYLHDTAYNQFHRLLRVENG